MPEKSLKYPSLPRFNPEIYDSSTMKLAKECFRKYFYRIVLGRVSPKSNYEVIFNFGSAYHKFREVLELSYMAGDAREVSFGKAIAAISQMKLVAGEGKYEFLTRQRLLETCQVAFEHWKKEKDSKRIEVIAVEQPFNIQLPNGKFIGGRADQIVKWSGKIWGRDFKTTSKIESYFNMTLDPNDQATRYVYMESKLTFGNSAITDGRYINGIIFEVIQNTKTTKPKIYNCLVTKNQFQLETWEREELFMHEMLELCKEKDIYPMCETSCSFCDYAKVCKAPSESSQENILKNDYLLSPWDFNKVEQTTLKEN